MPDQRPSKSKIQEPSAHAAQGFHLHDHGACVEDGLKIAKERCAEERLQLTPVRLRVLEILLNQHRAMGAYEILDILREEGLGSQPPVAYRALDFLTRHGFAHKIERLNAFVACAHSDERHVPAFLICTSCNQVAEAASDDVGQAMKGAAGTVGFTVKRMVVEAEGICPSCDADADGGLHDSDRGAEPVRRLSRSYRPA